MDVLAYCRAQAIRVSIISHRTRVPARGEPVNLRAAARAFLGTHGVLGAGAALRDEDVFFEASRAEKLNRIGTLRCTHFVDDLPELLCDPAFPENTVRILYAPDPPAEVDAGIIVCRHWAEIQATLAGERP
jgi:hypothetical protein